METVKSSHVLAIASCLATEALCVSAILYWEIFLVNDNVTINICHRHLGCWYEIEVVNLTMIHLTFLVWQLSCTIA